MEIINPEKLLLEIVTTLEEVKIPYFITGGFAVSVWGRPRATFDLDIVVELIEPKVEPLAKTLRKIYKAGYIDENVAKDAIRHSGEFNFIDPLTGVKVDFWVAKRDELSLLKFKRKVSKKISGKQVYFISPEDLILSKLGWHVAGESTRQLEDIESILKILGAKLDKIYLEKWTKKLGVGDILNKISKK